MMHSTIGILSMLLMPQTISPAEEATCVYRKLGIVSAELVSTKANPSVWSERTKEVARLAVQAKQECRDLYNWNTRQEDAAFTIAYLLPVQRTLFLKTTPYGFDTVRAEKYLSRLSIGARARFAAGTPSKADLNALLMYAFGTSKSFANLRAGQKGDIAEALGGAFGSIVVVQNAENAFQTR